MKLIVELSENDYKALKEDGVQNHLALADTIIACSVPYEERPQGKPIIKCQDCKYQVKEWREDKRMKEKGYWVYGCKHFGEIMGYWGFGGYDNEFCSDAEQRGNENDSRTNT